MVNVDAMPIRIKDITIICIAPNLFEIIPDEGIEISTEHVTKGYQYLLDNSQGAVALLINRRYQFSTSHEAMVQQDNMQWIAARAFLCHTYMSKAVSQGAIMAIKGDKNKLQVFMNRVKAIEWLTQRQQEFTVVDRALALE